MPDREKVIKGLKCHQIDKDHRINCSDCPYHCDEFMNGLNELHNDAIALLKEQEHKDRMFHALEEDWKKLKEQKVVRCKDCIYMEKMDVDIREGDLIWCSIHEFGREIDYYCADGEKRE